MPNKKKHKEPDGTMPQHVIHAINEHCVGGFFLFYFNQETGQPEQLLSCESPAHSLALQKHIADLSEGLHQLNINSQVNNIIHTLEQDEEDNGDDSKNS